MEIIEEPIQSNKPKKTLEIIPSQKFLMGVCSAFGNYIGVNPVIVRLIVFIAFIFVGQAVLLIYAAFGILLPHNDNLSEDNVYNANKLTLNFLYIFFAVVLLLLQAKVLSLKDLFKFFAEKIDAFSLLVLSIAMLINGYHKVSFSMSQSNYKLLRRTDKKVIFGVCGGLAEYLNIHPNLMRIIWIIFGISSLGMAVIIYIVLSFIIPPKNDS